MPADSKAVRPCCSQEMPSSRRPDQRVHVPQRRRRERNPERDVPLAAESNRAFEQAGGLAQVPPEAVDIRQCQTRQDEAVRVIERFGDLDGFLSMSVSLVEHAALGEGARQIAMGQHGGKHRDAKPFAGPIGLERLHQPPTVVFGTAIVT